LPSLAAAAVLEGEGLMATNLGPDTPISTLAIAAEELGVRLVWLSVSVAANVEVLRRSIKKLISQLAGQGVILVIGGSVASKLGVPKSDLVFVGRSMGELEALVQGMRLAPSNLT
jgi:methanogenic corrinoid protein MtbC1